MVSRYCCLVGWEEIEVVAVKISRRNHVLAGDELYPRLVELVVLCSLIYRHETFALEARNLLRSATGGFAFDHQVCVSSKSVASQ